MKLIARLGMIAAVAAAPFALAGCHQMMGHGAHGAKVEMKDCCKAHVAECKMEGSYCKEHAAAGAAPMDCCKDHAVAGGGGCCAKKM